ncbi:MAG: hypothetical protein JNL61_15165 [Rhizobiaceae bacterium]|nr:hypothetical protein [Rhizobiaceae bacterium]
MKDAGEKAPNEHLRRLSDAIREVKNAVADREDVVVDLRDAEKMRLDILAAELAPVFADVPVDADIFDFTISSGLRPRLWIDAVSHVGMGHDRRTYRFVNDTRMGRVVLAESPHVRPVADQVIRYIAERLVERERLLDGQAVSVAPAKAIQSPASAEPVLPAAPQKDRVSSVLGGLGLLAAGVLVGLAIAVILLWDRLTTHSLGM